MLSVRSKVRVCIKVIDWITLNFAYKFVKVAVSTIDLIFFKLLCILELSKLAMFLLKFQKDFLHQSYRHTFSSKHSILQTFWKFYFLIFHATFVLRKNSIYWQKIIDSVSVHQFNWPNLPKFCMQVFSPDRHFIPKTVLINFDIFISCADFRLWKFSPLQQISQVCCIFNKKIDRFIIYSANSLVQLAGSWCYKYFWEILIYIFFYSAWTMKNQNLLEMYRYQNFNR